MLAAHAQFSPLSPARASPILLRGWEGGTLSRPSAASDVQRQLSAPPSPLPRQLVNQHVYSGSADKTAKCWLVDTGESVRTFTAHRRSVSALKYHAGTCKWPRPPPSPCHPSLPHQPCRCLSLSLLSLQQVLPGQGLSASLPLLQGPLEPQLSFRMVSAEGQRPRRLYAASVRVIYKGGLNKAVGMLSHIDPLRTCSSQPACSEVLGSRAPLKDTF